MDGITVLHVLLCVFFLGHLYTNNHNYILLHAYTHRRIQIPFLGTNHYKPSHKHQKCTTWVRLLEIEWSKVQNNHSTAKNVLQNVFSNIAVSTGHPSKILPQTRNKFFTCGNISGTNEINNGRTILDRPSWIPILDTHQLTHTNLQQHRRVKFNEACACVRGIVPCSWLWSSCSVFCFSTWSDAMVIRGEGSWE